MYYNRNKNTTIHSKAQTLDSIVGESLDYGDDTSEIRMSGLSAVRIYLRRGTLGFANMASVICKDGAKTLDDIVDEKQCEEDFFGAARCCSNLSLSQIVENKTTNSYRGNLSLENVGLSKAVEKSQTPYYWDYAETTEEDKRKVYLRKKKVMRLSHEC